MLRWPRVERDSGERTWASASFIRGAEKAQRRKGVWRPTALYALNVEL